MTAAAAKKILLVDDDEALRLSLGEQLRLYEFITVETGTGVDALNRAAMTASQPLRDLRRSGLRALKTIKPLHRGAMRIGLGAGRHDSIR